MPDDPAPFPRLRLAARDLAAERGGRPVFAALSFELAAGQMMAVTGPNGSGKSTLLRMIAGLLKPAAGTLAVEPADGAETVLHYVGHLNALKSGMTVEENLRFWARLWGNPGRVDDALDALGLMPLAHLPVAVLSAGQRRRAALARLLAVRRPMWLLDEPATALDRAGEAQLGRLLSDHLTAGGLAIVATHLDLPVAPAVTVTLGAA